MDRTELIIMVTDIGGPPVLHDVLTQLPGSFSLPLIVFQTGSSGLLESTRSALSKTIAIDVNTLEPETLLQPGTVYFSRQKTLYEPVVRADGIFMKSIPCDPESCILGSNLERFSQELGGKLTAVFLSGREPIKISKQLSDCGSVYLVLDRKEALVFEQGKSILAAGLAAEELSSTQIVNRLLLGAKKHSHEKSIG